MLSKLILDKLIPLPDETEEMQRLQEELDRDNFPVTYLRPGGIFYMLARIMVRIQIELTTLARSIISNVNITSADNVDWLSVLGAGYSLPRKEAVKTRGALTLTRETASAVVRIPKGCIFKTEPDSTGEELRFLSTVEVIFATGMKSCTVPVEAELAGAAYNVPSNRINRCLIHLESVTGITNLDGWITLEGSDIEGIDSYRSRLLGVWDRQAQNPTAGSYKSVCEAVPGVLYIGVHDQHPRGQGTIDIVVTSATGAATATLLAAVDTAAHSIAGPYDDILVKSSETVAQDIAVTVVLPMALTEDGIKEIVQDTIAGLFEIDRSRILNELYLSDLIVALKQELPTAKGVRITTPAADLVLSSDKVIVMGNITVTIERA